MSSTFQRFTLVAAAISASSLLVLVGACGSSSHTATSASSSSTPSAHGSSLAQPFDLEAHRGGRGEHTEESLYGYARSIEMGVTTLELDIVLTKDNVPLVWHDPSIQAEKCADTKPATPGDTQFPYVGQVIHNLSYAQIQTLTCAKKLDKFPTATVVDGNKIATLPELFDLTARYKGNDLRFNIETKIEADNRQNSAEPEEFVKQILQATRTAGLMDKIDIQSFDWRSLPIVRAQAPSVPLVALYDSTTWKPASAWLGPVSFEQFHGDVVAAAHSAGFNILSPDYQLVDAKLVDAAHSAGLTVIPWTVNDEADIRRELGLGVDGIITDYPTRLRGVLAAQGKPLPRGYTA